MNIKNPVDTAITDSIPSDSIVNCHVLDILGNHLFFSICKTYLNSSTVDSDTWLSNLLPDVHIPNRPAISAGAGSYCNGSIELLARP